MATREDRNDKLLKHFILPNDDSTEFFTNPGVRGFEFARKSEITFRCCH